MKRLVLLLAPVAILAACAGDPDGPRLDPERFRTPAAADGPWVRWWWPGADVDDAEIRREVALLAAHGFGGAEIQPLDAALDPGAPADELARRRAFDGDAWYARLATALQAARDAGLAIDLNLGSGWNAGGGHVAVADSMQTLVFAERAVTGPATARLTLDAPDRPVFYDLADMAGQLGEPLARWMPETARRVAVIAARVLEDGRNPDVWDLQDQVRLDPASLRVLTDAVAADGTLAWEVPEGDWRVIAFFAMADGQFVSLVADSRPAYVVDHFSADRFRATLDHLLGDRTGLAAWFGAPLRAFFDDSFELESERHWTDDFLAEFQARRGYDLVPWLPVAVPPGADDHLFDGGGVKALAPFVLGDDDERVRHDVQLTVSDLFRDRFLATAAAWGAERGLQHRVQPYGVRVDVIRAAGESDIPETETLYAGGTALALKAVSSGAHLYGRNLVSAEAFSWAGREYATTPLKAKAAADKLFLAGVNHLVLHGFPYRKTTPEYGPTGWHPFGSPFSGNGSYTTMVGEADPFWPFQAEWNAYVARCQYVLRQGRPEADVLVYYPFLGMPGSLQRLDGHYEDLYRGAFPGEAPVPENALLGLVDQVSGGKFLGAAAEWLQAAWPVLQALEDRGYTWEYVNDERLAAAVAAGGAIEVGGARYRSVLVLDAPWMTREAARSLGTLAERVPVVVAGTVPARQPGYLDRAAGDAEVAREVRRAVATMPRADVARDGVVDAVAARLPASLAPEGDVPTSALRHLSRRLAGDARVFFLRNGTNGVLWTIVRPVDGCEDARWLDPGTGTWIDAGAVDGAVTVSLFAWGTRFLLCGDGEGFPPAAAAPGWASPPRTRSSVEGWTLEVTGPDVKDGAVRIEDDALGDWRDKPDLASAGSAGTYTATVDLAELPPRAYLDLGAVGGAARVRVNGREVGSALAPPWKVEITDALASRMTVEVEVVPPLRNRLVGMAQAGDATVARFKSGGDSRVPAGLLGPVSLDTSR